MSDESKYYHPATTGEDLASSLKLHDNYSQGDIQLLSADSVLFITYAWRLARASAVFRDMMEVTQPSTVVDSSFNSSGLPTMNNKEPIEIGHTSALLERFLDIISLSDQNMIEVPYGEAAGMFDLCDQFDFDKKIVDKIRQQVIKQGHSNPWELLILGSKLDDKTMGLQALRMMDHDIFIKGKPGHKFWATMEELENGWRPKLLDLVFKDPGEIAGAPEPFPHDASRPSIFGSQHASRPLPVSYRAPYTPGRSNSSSTVLLFKDNNWASICERFLFKQ
ncbi:hypothetical protein CNBG1940 [Cryptococcus deneoformans B-3501A]|uniref:hypothetical protein n=1 Tax=Cryptococcus deneoformans (strain B-3501A) TaxID=283643 RepID=UPI000042DA9B|nr:hypothetical protein CNBG1940 [Cryptococcus neoformans var. neoformans B-3501A]EAL19565.1 hypothetical protein CNBG1940 [Cryptococcus neoformans var. neoformans B-3501A]